MKTQWDGLRVCEECYDPRHQQDAVRDTGFNCGNGNGGTGLDWNLGGGLWKPDQEPNTFIKEPNDAYFTNPPEDTFGCVPLCSQQCGEQLEWWFNNYDNTGTECYPERVNCLSTCLDDTALYIALDLSGSMVTNTSANGETRLANAKSVLEAMLTAVQENIADMSMDIGIVGWSKAQQDELIIRNVTSSDIDTLISHVNGMDILGDDWTWFWKGTELSADFYTNASDPSWQKVMWFITDGEPYYALGDQRADFLASLAADYLFATPNVVSYGINIDLENTFYTEYVDNTPQDGVPVIRWD
jgi:hypothetical protein